MKSIIVPVFNQRDFTDECLLSVLENTRDLEIIVIDNASNPAYQPPFSGFIETRVIRNEMNLGFPKAVNQGIAAAKGEVIILLNNDVIVTPEWAERLESALDEFDIVSPVTNFAAGIQRVAIDPYDTKQTLYQQAGAWAEDYDGIVEPVNFVIGFCMAFKKSLFDEIGPFDESLWPCSGEEIDFCFRAREAGKTVGIVHDVYVHHEGNLTFMDMEKSGALKYGDICKRNNLHLAERWGADFWMRQAIPQAEGVTA
jgi:GT2 family glycosyltransferase